MPNRTQLEWRASDLESLLPPGHRARLVWGYVERQNLEGLYGGIKAVEGGAGRAAIAPESLYALWLYATLEGVGHARGIARLTQSHEAYRWICGGVQVNYHTLADFRSQEGDALDDLLTGNVASKTFAAPLAVLVLASFALAPVTEARDGGRAGGGGGAASARAGGVGGGGGARASGGNRQVDSSRVDSRANNVRSTSVNNVNTSRNTNVNANRNVNVNVDSRDGCGGCGGCGGWDDDYHPVATAAAVTATVAVTAAVVGSIVNKPPANCVPVNYGGMVYQQCGSTWYQPQGNQYVVVNPPY